MYELLKSWSYPSQYADKVRMPCGRLHAEWKTPCVVVAVPGFIHGKLPERLGKAKHYVKYRDVDIALEKGQAMEGC